MATLIPAFKSHHALIEEMDFFKDESEGFRIWWLGQSGFLIQWQGKRLLFDPYLSDSLTQKYLYTDKPHTRMSDLVVDPNLLHSIDIVTSSHNHTDHLDAASLQPILANNPEVVFIIPEANRKFVADRVQCAMDFPIGMNDNGKAFRHKGFTFYGLASKHNEIDRDAYGHCHYIGYVVKFGPYTVYHSGDTLWYDDMVANLLPMQVDVALLPINGDDAARKVAGNLNAHEAVTLGKAINAKSVVPCHYDMFEFNTADVNDFIEEAKNQNQGYVVLKGGECHHFNQW